MLLSSYTTDCLHRLLIRVYRYKSILRHMKAWALVQTGCSLTRQVSLHLIGLFVYGEMGIASFLAGWSVGRIIPFALNVLYHTIPQKSFKPERLKTHNLNSFDYTKSVESYSCFSCYKCLKMLNIPEQEYRLHVLLSSYQSKSMDLDICTMGR